MKVVEWRGQLLTANPDSGGKQILELRGRYDPGSGASTLLQPGKLHDAVAALLQAAGLHAPQVLEQDVALDARRLRATDQTRRAGGGTTTGSAVSASTRSRPCISSYAPIRTCRPNAESSTKWPICRCTCR